MKTPEPLKNKENKCKPVKQNSEEKTKGEYKTGIHSGFSYGLLYGVQNTFFIP